MELIPFLMYMRFQRRGVAWSFLVVFLTTIRFSCRNSNSFWTWFDSHINNIKVIHIYLLVNGEVLRHLNRRKIGPNCRCVNYLDFKQNGMPMALMSLLQILYQVFCIICLFMAKIGITKKYI